MIYRKIENLIKELKNQYDIEEIKNQFKNVYFIIGTAYAGKSTMVKMLSKHYNGIMCEENYGLKYLKKYNVNPNTHPNLTYTDTHTMIEFVTRSPKEYYDWLRETEIEIAPIEINELLELTNKYPDKKIFVDTSIPMEILKLISNHNNVIVMLSEKSMSVDRFFDREDYEKQIIFRAINKTSDPKASMENYKKVLEKANSKERYNYFLNSGFYVFKRDDSLSLIETRDILAKHLGFNKVIKK